MFITFEGIEGCGKSTQAKRLVNRLRELAVPLVFTLEPGGTSVGQKIRRILLDSRNQHLSPLAELLLYAADRAQHVEEVIKPALEQEKWVLCDRFFDATTVYQGYARGLDMKLIVTLNEKASPGIRPDITFLIDCAVEIGLERALKRNRIQFQEGQDRFEREKKDFHEAVREGYLTMAMEDRERFVVVDGTLKE
ncbi:MAG: dTMP kinase, partial [Desulfobacteraceae bacterium]